MKYCDIEGCNNKLWAKGLCSSHYCRKWEKENPDKHRKTYNLRRKKNIIKIRVRNLVATHIKRGKIYKKPCEICGLSEVHAHHEDYSQPFKIRWLCRKHHIELHTR